MFFLLFSERLPGVEMHLRAGSNELLPNSQNLRKRKTDLHHTWILVYWPSGHWRTSSSEYPPLLISVTCPGSFDTATAATISWRICAGFEVGAVSGRQILLHVSSTDDRSTSGANVVWNVRAGIWGVTSRFVLLIFSFFGDFVPNLGDCFVFCLSSLLCISLP